MSSQWLDIVLTWFPLVTYAVLCPWYVIQLRRYWRERRGLINLVAWAQVIAGPADGDPAAFVGQMHEAELRVSMYQIILASRAALAAAGIKPLYARDLADDHEGPAAGPVGPEDDPSWGKR